MISSLCSLYLDSPFSSLDFRLGKTKMNIVVHNLSFSMDVNVTKTANNTVWQDLKERWWMDKKEKTTKKILRNVSFVIKEKMMVLLLGPTGFFFFVSFGTCHYSFF